MIPKKINLESIEEDSRWANVIAPTLSQTLRNLRRLQQERQKQLMMNSWAHDYDELEDEENANTCRRD